MKDTTILQFKADKSKVSAIQICLADKNGSMEAELTDFIDALYKKYVPQTVRDYIEKAELAEQADRQSRRSGTNRVKLDLSAGNTSVGNYPSEKK